MGIRRGEKWIGRGRIPAQPRPPLMASGGVSARGAIRVGLVDLRRSSPTYLASATIDIGEAKPLGIFIPEGVAHGFAALSDCTLMYIVNNYYDGGGDEYGIAWDDPQVGIDWGIQEPHLSDRDRSNPLIADLPADAQPR